MVVRVCRLLLTGGRPAISQLFYHVPAERLIRPMTVTNDAPRSFTLALEAIGNLWQESCAKLDFSMVAFVAHTEIESRLVSQKSGTFYRHFLPWRSSVSASLADIYRRCFKLALAHPHQAGRNPELWAWSQLRPGVGAALEWIRDWYMLACDVENQYVMPMGTIPFAEGQTVSLAIPATLPPLPPPKSWRAPAWLFSVSTLVGIGPLKSEHVPATDTEERLGVSHTRLLLKGAHRAFLRDLGAAIQTVWNEETAAAGAIPAPPLNGKRREPNKRRGWQQKQKLYSAIQKALSRDPSLQGINLCAELDRRHAPPLFDWKKRGEWRDGLTFKEAWRVPGLRKKIRRVRQEAMKTH